MKDRVVPFFALGDRMQYSRSLILGAVILALLFSAVPQRLLAVDPTLLLGYNGGVNDNPHNLSRLATHSGPKAVDDGPNSDNDTRICVYCHTPHGGTPQTPLWNRKNPVRMGSFPLFDNGPDSARIAIDDAAITATSKYEPNGTNGVEYPNGATKLCLSCHDGATAIGEMANGVSIAMTQNTITDKTKIFDPLDNTTNDFAASHPVSFVYDATVAAYISAQPGKSVYSLPADPDVRLDGQSRMQCTTCHNPHLDTNNGTTYTLPFWANYDSNGTDEQADYDATCAQCHTDKGGAFNGHNL